MHAFERLIYDRFSQSIASWDTNTFPDIYAIYFELATVWCPERIIQGQVRLGYNTLANFEEGRKNAISEEDIQEAKWSLTFWLAELRVSVPREVEDFTDLPKDELALQDAWCTSVGIFPDEIDDSGYPLYDEVRLYDALREVCRKTGQALHANGVIVAKFGKAIPIIMQDLETYEVHAEVTRAMNPPGLSHEAEKWFLGK
jgi:hypothetical protein